jgi:hypothetical protein
MSTWRGRRHGSNSRRSLPAPDLLTRGPPLVILRFCWGDRNGRKRSQPMWRPPAAQTARGRSLSKGREGLGEGGWSATGLRFPANSITDGAIGGHLLDLFGWVDWRHGESLESGNV